MPPPRAVSLVALLLVGCHGVSPPARPAPVVHVALARPYALEVPASYRPGKPMPLVILLHGFASAGRFMVDYFDFDQLAQARGFFVAAPDGTRDARGYRFWNATDACCDIDRSGVDDVAYLDALIDDVTRRFAIDAKRVFLVGQSNGGFMAHRYACDRAARVAGIVSVAGAGFRDESRCRPSEPVAVLQIHGDADTIVPYGGGALGTAEVLRLLGRRAGSFPVRGDEAPAPSAHETMRAWARANHCRDVPETAAARLDLDGPIRGDETDVERWAGCAGGAAELWTIRGGAHVVTPRAEFGEAVYAFLAAHPKP